MNNKLKRFLQGCALATAITCLSVGLVACGNTPTNDSDPPKQEQSEGVAGTYTATYTNGMGSDETAQIVLTADGKATLSFPGDAIQGGDEYIGTYTVESDGKTVSIKDLTDEDNANSIHPGIQAGWIDSSTGDCQITIINSTTFERVLTETNTETYVSGDFTYTADGVTYEVELSLDGSCGYKEGNGKWIEGTYHMDGTTVSITLNSYDGSASFIKDKAFTIVIEQGETAGEGTFTVVVEAELVLDAQLSVGEYSFSVNPIGDIIETYTLTLNKSTGTCTFSFANSSIGSTTTFNGSYTNDGGTISMTGLVDADGGKPEEINMMGNYIFADYFTNGAGTAKVYTNGLWAIVGTNGDLTGKAPSSSSEETIGGGTTTEDVWSSGEVKTVSYVTNGTDSQTMDVYVSSSSSATNKLPLMVVIHGGAFTMGDSKMSVIQPYYQYFRDNGYIVASLNYSLNTSTTPAPQAIVDVKTAIQYLYDNADTYNIDKTNITVMGESAGGYLAIMASVTGASDFKASGASDYSYTVSALVDFYAPVYASADSGLQGYVGNGNEYNPETYLAGGNKNLSIWIQCGDSDTMVNYQQNSATFKSALEIAGYTVEYGVVADAGHMDSKFYTDENLASVARWLRQGETYTYAETKDVMGTATTETSQIVLYSDGTCELSVQGGQYGPFAATHTGKYVKDGNTVYIYGLTYTATPIGGGDLVPNTMTPGTESEEQMKFSFITNGCCTITLTTDGKFTPATKSDNVTEETAVTYTQASLMGGDEEVFTITFKADGTCTLTSNTGIPALQGPYTGKYVKYGDVYVITGLVDANGTAAPSSGMPNFSFLKADGSGVIKVTGSTFVAVGGTSTPDLSGELPALS